MTNDTNPGSKSADEVQREVRQSRAEVEDAWRPFKIACLLARCSIRR
jgi:hypothetical protein